MRTVFLLNPTAGKADCTRTLPQQINVAAARAGLAPEEYAIQVTNHAGHARELANAAAQQARQSGEELRVFTAGGDGTFNEALTGIYGYANAAVGCLPFGSGNDFLRTFGTKEEFLDLDAQLAGGPVSIDLMQTSLGLSATICAAGLDAQVAYGIPKFRRIPLCGGEMAYVLSIVEQLCGHIGRRVEYTIDGETLDVDCLMCAICNGRTYGGGFCAAPEAQPDDGWLDVYIIRKVSRVTIAKLLGMYKSGKHFQNGQLVRAAEPYFIYRRAKQVSLRAADGRGPIVATADGECAPKEQITVQVQCVLLKEQRHGEVAPEARVAIAQAANDLLTIQGVDASFVAVQVGTGVNISARSLGAVNVQVIMESLGGGGHQTMAAAQLKHITPEAARARIEGAIDKYYASQKKGDVEGK